MNSIDKPRSDSKLKTLPEDRQFEIAEFALNHSLSQTVDWLKASGLDTNSASLSQFLAWYRVRQQTAKNESTVLQLLAEAAERNPDLTPERIYELGQMFFSGLALTQQDARAWCLTQRTGLSKARVELAIQKYRDQKAATEVPEDRGGLTPETIDKIEKELRLC